MKNINLGLPINVHLYVLTIFQIFCTAILFVVALMMIPHSDADERDVENWLALIDSNGMMKMILSNRRVHSYSPCGSDDD